MLGKPLLGWRDLSLPAAMIHLIALSSPGLVGHVLVFSQAVASSGRDCCESRACALGTVGSRAERASFPACTVYV